MSRGGFSDLEVPGKNPHVALWVCVQHMWKKLFCGNIIPEKVISAGLMEDFTIHIMAQSPTFTVIYQPSTKTQHHDSSVEKPILTSHTIMDSEQKLFGSSSLQLIKPSGNYY